MARIQYGTENFSTTLNVGGGINNSQTTGIILQNVSGLNTSGGILGLDWASTIDTSTYEEIEYTGLSGNELTGVTRGVGGTSAKTHNNGATIVSVISSLHQNRVADRLRSVDAILANDPNENEIIKTTYVASAVNEVTITNATTGNGPIIAPTGGDTNIDLNLNTKGTGVVKINGATYASAATDGWTADSNTWTYSSVDGATGVITINADLTGVIQIGDRIKFTQTTVKYFIVTKTPTYAASATTLTFWGGTDYTLTNAAISSPSYSHQKTPFGFNADPTKWTVRVTDTTDRSQASAAASTWYNLGTTNEQINIPIGTWDVWYSVALHTDAASAAGLFATLSSANNSESDSELTANVQSPSTFGGGGSISKQKTLSLSAKATYYLNTKTLSGATPTIYNRNGTSGAPMVIEARCAYL